MFARNVMREIRAMEETSTPWWRKLLSPAPLATGLGAVACAVAAVAMLKSATPSPQPPLAQTPVEMVAPDSQDALLEQLILAAVDEPELISDDELLDLVGLY